jgi:hypothetical protein
MPATISARKAILHGEIVCVMLTVGRTSMTCSIAAAHHRLSPSTCAR